MAMADDYANQSNARKIPPVWHVFDRIFHWNVWSEILLKSHALTG